MHKGLFGLLTENAVIRKDLPHNSFESANSLHFNSAFPVAQVEALLKGSLFACVNSIPETVLIENHIVHSSPIPNFIIPS